MDNSTAKASGFWGHVIAGFFLLAFGSFLSGLTAFRLLRIAASSDVDCTHLVSPQAPSLAQQFLQQHAPETNKVLLRRLSIALLLSTTFGIVYEGLGAIYIHPEQHPDYTFFSYATHQTLTLLYFLAGFTGFLESYHHLPADSLRVSVVAATAGEALLWYGHALTQSNATDERVHMLLALVSLLTALFMTISIFLTASGNKSPNMSLFFYVGGFVGILWKGLWFFTAAVHERWPIAVERTDVYFVLQGIFLAFACELVAVYLCHVSSLSSKQEERWRTAEEDKLVTGGNNDGRRQTYAPLPLENDGTEDI